MRHKVAHSKLSRNTNARRALLKNLATNLVLHERIVTTIAKAKAVKPFVEKLVTKAKDDSLVNRRYLLGRLGREAVVKKLFELVGPTFKDRPGGYLRIIRLLPRSGDRAEMAVIEFVEKVSEAAARRKLEDKAPRVEAKKPKRKEVPPAKLKQASKKIRQARSNQAEKKKTAKKKPAAK
ncbi:MAG TPA: 50S ribosomal protein L17 [Candidatus Nanoarchaeia archaeon]